jgi:hypothetical protein
VYLLLVGKRANAGDHLIVDRARRLLARHRPDRKLVEVERWRPLDDCLDRVNAARALILCGGPALQPDLYPGVYPLARELERIRIPIVALGLGWKGIPGDEADLERYAFSERSHALLARLARGPLATSCRDHLTRRVLERHGVTNALVTGCPAWYDLRFVGTPFAPPRAVRRIVVSTPFAAARYRGQVLELVAGLRALFPQASIAAAFQHGWSAGPHVPAALAGELERLRGELERAGVESHDLAASLEAMERLYADAELHVGYRVHSHLLCLSRRKPSFLLEEDGRGRGADEALRAPGAAAWEHVVPAALTRSVEALPWVGPRARARLARRLRPRAGAAREIVERVALAAREGFACFAAVGAAIDAHHASAMAPFLASLP